MFRTNVWKPVLVLAVVVALAAPASAVLVFSDDFEGNTVGANPAGWSLYNDLLPANGDIGVDAGTPTGGSGSKVLEISKTTTTGDSFGLNNNHTDTTEGLATLSFKFKLDSESDFRVEADGGGGAKTYLRLRPGAGGLTVFSGAFTTQQDLTDGHWYEVVKSFDFSGNTWDFSIEDLDDTAAPNTYTGLGFSTPTNVPTKLSLVNITSVSATRMQNAQLDDFVVSEFAAVPEPSAFAFGSLVVMLLGFVKARRQSA